MTGATYGDSTGATYGQSTGGTYGVAEPNYLLDGRPLPAFTSEVATHQRLTLGFRVTTQTLLDALRTAKTDEDQVDVLATDDGGFSAVDRADGANTFTLTPPPSRQPLRTAGTYHVARYEESLVSQTVEEWQVEIEFVRDADRVEAAPIDYGDQDVTAGAGAGATYGDGTGATYGNATGGSYGGTRYALPADHWELGTRYGPIATDRVDAEFLGTGADGVERFELTARLTHRQAYSFETALSRVGGVRVRAVPDGTNVAVDDTSGDDLTVDVTSPTEDVVSSGKYVVTEWTGRRLNDAFGSYDIVLAVAG